MNSTDAFAVFSSNTDAVTESNFRRDIDGSGQINSTDAFAAFANNTNGLPDAPTPPSPPATFVSAVSSVASVTTPIVSSVRSFETDSVEAEAGSSLDAVAESSPELALAGSSTAASSSLDAAFEIADDEEQTSFEVRDGLFGDLENSDLLPKLI